MWLVFVADISHARIGLF